MSLWQTGMLHFAIFSDHLEQLVDVSDLDVVSSTKAGFQLRHWETRKGIRQVCAELCLH